MNWDELERRTLPKCLAPKNTNTSYQSDQTLKDKDTEMLQRKYFTFFTCCIGLDIRVTESSWVFFLFYTWISVLCEECLCLSCRRLSFLSGQDTCHAVYCNIQTSTPSIEALPLQCSSYLHPIRRRDITCSFKCVCNISENFHRN